MQCKKEKNKDNRVKEMQNKLSPRQINVMATLLRKSLLEIRTHTLVRHFISLLVLERCDDGKITCQQMIYQNS